MDSVMQAKWEDAKRRGNRCHQCSDRAEWDCSVCSAPLCERHGELRLETCGAPTCIHVALQREKGCGRAA